MALNFIGNPSTSDDLKNTILSTLTGNTSSFILVVGPRRVGKDFVLHSINPKTFKIEGSSIYDHNDPDLVLEDLQLTNPPLIDLGELNCYGTDNSTESSTTRSQIRATAYDRIIDFSKEKGVPIVANLSISKHTANPWNITGIEERWETFLTDVLKLSLPDNASIHYLHMDRQLCASKLWDLRENPDTFVCYGGNMMCIPNFGKEHQSWAEKSENDFFRDLSTILDFPLKSNAQIIMEQVDEKRNVEM
jgi:hypothetical protein